MGMNYSRIEEWILKEDSFDPSALGKCESVMSLGNGYLGLRSATEEHYLNETRDLLVAGTFNKFDEYEVTELPNAADVTAVEIRVNGVPFSLEQGETIEYSRELNIRTGELRRDVIWRSPQGDTLQFTFQRIVSLKRLHTIAQRILIRPLEGDADIEIRSGIDGRMTNCGSQHFSDGDKRFYDKKYIQFVQRTSQSHIYFVCGTAHTLSLNGKLLEEEPQVYIERRKIYAGYTVKLHAGDELCVEKISGVYSTRDKDTKGTDVKQLQERALEGLKRDCSDGYLRLAAESAGQWETEVWEKAPILIESENPLDQMMIRFAQYHLRIMTPVHDSRMNIGAKGLSGEGYKGHTFWDTEIFILPYYMFTDPAAARKLLEYRYQSLSGAHRKAEGNHYEGAQFPWESAWLDDGEVTPLWDGVDVTTGLPNKVWSGIIEQHVTADIAFAAWQYGVITGDQDFMDRYGYELIMDAAKFWSSRLEYAEEDGMYHINDVVGPDEYKEHVNDNAFTNYMAYWNIRKAMECYEQIKNEKPEIFSRLADRMDLERVYVQWTERAGKIFLPAPREEDLVIAQDSTYLTLDMIDLSKYRKQEHAGGIMRDYSLKQINQIQVSKQADILVLFFLLEDMFSAKVKRANWNYYEPKCLHDSSLSLSTHSVLACDMGDKEMAYGLFQRAGTIDMGPFMKSSDAGIHAASFGGVWECVVYGFGGVRMLNGNLRINPSLPDQWSRLSYTLLWKGQKLSVDITKERMVIRNETGKAKIPLEAAGKNCILEKELILEREQNG